MSANTWSILLAAIGIIGLYISGSKNKLGWAISMASSRQLLLMDMSMPVTITGG
jgi:hypothetical protein